MRGEKEQFSRDGAAAQVIFYALPGAADLQGEEDWRIMHENWYVMQVRFTEGNRDLRIGKFRKGSDTSWGWV